MRCCFELAGARVCIYPFYWFLFWCFVGAVVSRLIFSAFRARAMVVGDYPEHDASDRWTFRPAFWVCFHGWGSDKRHHDLLLPFLIALIDLLVYPILLQLGYFVTIGAWLALKTSGQWSGWRISRTSFNRFLFSNLFHLGYAFFALRHFVQKGDSASVIWPW